MNAVFVDPVYLLALEIANDQTHSTTAEHWQRIATGLPLLVSSSYASDEVVTFFNGRGYYATAAEVGNNLLHSPSVLVTHVDETKLKDGHTSSGITTGTAL